METLNQTNSSSILQPQAEEPSPQGGLLQGYLFRSDGLQESSLPPLLFQLGVDTALPCRIGYGHEHGQTENDQAGHRTGICRLRLFVPTRELVSTRFPAVALVTEIPGQNGVSVTEGIEIIAAQVCRIHGLKPHNTILIEHYDERENGYGARLPGRVNEEKFSCVVFEERHANADIERTFRLQRPRWRPLGKEEVEALIGLPLP